MDLKSYHVPWSIEDLCNLCKELNEALEEFIVVIKTGSGQNQADNI